MACSPPPIYFLSLQNSFFFFSFYLGQSEQCALMRFSSEVFLNQLCYVGKDLEKPSCVNPLQSTWLLKWRPGPCEAGLCLHSCPWEPCTLPLTRTPTYSWPIWVTRYQQDSDREAQRGQIPAGLFRIPGFYWEDGSQENSHTTIISFSCQLQYIGHPSIRNAFPSAKECKFEGVLMSILMEMKRKYDQ